MIIEQSNISNFADKTWYSCGEKSIEIRKNLVFDTKKIKLILIKFLKIQPYKILIHDFWGQLSSQGHIKNKSMEVEASVYALLLEITTEDKS